jgi:hypothetical protein
LWKQPILLLPPHIRSLEDVLRYSIVLDRTSARFEEEVKRGGNILATLFITIGDFAFPSPPHMDFAVIVLAWWLDAYHRSLRDKATFSNDFMDGPYSCVFVPQGESLLLECQYHGLEGDFGVGGPFLIDARQYADELTRCSRDLVQVLDSKGYKNRDLEQLRASLIV